MNNLLNKDYNTIKKSFLMVILFAIVAMAASCTSSSSLEKKAKKEMKKQMTKVAKDPKSVKIDNVETVYLDDSICILNYDFSANNSLKQRVTTQWEFIYQIESDGDETACCTELVGDVQSVLTQAKKQYHNTREAWISEYPNDMDFRKRCLSFQILIRKLNEGYYVVGRNDIYIKLDENGEVQMYQRSNRKHDYIDTW
jgi:biopolymer transport protein ExbD